MVLAVLPVPPVRKIAIAAHNEDVAIDRNCYSQICDIYKEERCVA